MKKLLALATVFLLHSLALQSQVIEKDTSTYLPLNHNIGISLSTLSGSGLSYRYAFNKRIQVQLNGIALQSKKGESDSWFYSSIGAELQIGLPIKASSFGIERVYGLLGVSYNTADNRGYGSTFFGTPYNQQESLFTTGIGLGFQTPTISGFHFVFHGTYFLRNTVRNENEEILVGGRHSRWVVNPLDPIRDITVGLGIGAYFSF